MQFISIILLGFALSMDSMAVAITCGLQQQTQPRKQGMILVALFALFHILMLILGGLLGELLGGIVEELDHWIAFTLLFIIGLKMFIEGYRYKIREHIFSIYNLSVIILLSLATSIDAFVVGISVVLNNTFSHLLLTSLIVSMIVFIMSVLGVEMGRRAYFFKPRLAQMTGGVVLILLGIKILAEHHALA